MTLYMYVSLYQTGECAMYESLTCNSYDDTVSWSTATNHDMIYELNFISLI